MNTHLTDEQLDHFLTHPQEEHPHLATCAVCRNQLTTLRAGILNLRSTLIAFADTVPYPTPAPATRPRPRTAWIVATASLALGIALLPTLHHPTAIPTPTTATTNQEDEALLQEINQDLSTPIAPSLKPLSIEPSPAKN